MRSVLKIRLSIVALALLAMGTACGSQRDNSGVGASPAPTSSTGVPSASPSTAGQSPSPVAPATPPSPASPTGTAGVVWPIEVRTLPAVSTAGPAVLSAISTGEHSTYERLVLTFRSAYGKVTVHYVPVVRADPSDRPVTLQGHTYLQVTVQAATARWGDLDRPYTGPVTLTPAYSTLRQARISGDFEAVLSVGVGLDRVAGFRLMRLRNPDRLVLDLAKRPAWQLWPDASLAAARNAQTAFDQGHQPWRGDPVAVATLYARQALGSVSGGCSIRHGVGGVGWAGQ